MNEKIGALWTYQDKNGNDYYSGTLDGVNKGVVYKIVAFAVRNKKNPKQPDWEIFFSQPAGDKPPYASDETATPPLSYLAQGLRKTDEPQERVPTIDEEQGVDVSNIPF